MIGPSFVDVQHMIGITGAVDGLDGIDLDERLIGVAARQYRRNSEQQQPRGSTRRAKPSLTHVTHPPVARRGLTAGGH